MLPGSAKEKPNQGEVIAVGEGKLLENGELRPVGVKAGDQVIFGQYSGSTVKVDGEELIILNESDVSLPHAEDLGLAEFECSFHREHDPFVHRAVESYVLARYYMYQQVYHHKTGRAASAMLVRILQRAADLIERDGDVFVSEPLRKLLLDIRTLSADEFVSLDDVSLTYAMRQWMASSDPVLSDLTRRFLRRQIFKTMPIEPGRYEMQRADIAELVGSRGFDPRYYLVLDRAVSDPYSDGLFRASHDEVGESIYLLDRRMRLHELIEHSELIQAVTNRLMTRDRLCLPGELRPDVEALLG